MADRTEAPKGIDISSELYRLYDYGGGTKLRIDNPVELHVLKRSGEQDSHRVIDADGVTHRPERGWLGISWRPRPGAPAFVA